MRLQLTTAQQQLLQLLPIRNAATVRLRIVSQ
jgi:hypothetical protein